MNLFFVSYCAEAPTGLPESVVADHCVKTGTRAGETIEFHVDRPVGSACEVARIVVLSVLASLVSEVRAVGEPSRLTPGP